MIACGQRNRFLPIRHCFSDRIALMQRSLSFEMILVFKLTMAQKPGGKPGNRLGVQERIRGKRSAAQWVILRSRKSRIC